MSKQDHNTPNQGDIVVEIHIQGVNNVFLFVSNIVFPWPETANTISSAVRFPWANIHCLCICLHSAMCWAPQVCGQSLITAILSSWSQLFSTHSK